MLGLIVLLVGALYLVVSLWVMVSVFDWAGKNKQSAWWGVLAIFVMYNLVFWDWIPTVVMHKYYCSTQAGFWVYKTPEQWVKENPDLTADDLKLLGNSKRFLEDFHDFRPLKSNPSKKVIMINQRIYQDSTYEKNIISILPIHKMTTFFSDINNDSRLAEEVTFGSGYGSPMTNGGLLGFKGWLENATCSNSSYVYPPQYIKFINQIFALGK